MQLDLPRLLKSTLNQILEVLILKMLIQILLSLVIFTTTGLMTGKTTTTFNLMHLNILNQTSEDQTQRTHTLTSPLAHICITIGPTTGLIMNKTREILEANKSGILKKDLRENIQTTYLSKNIIKFIIF